MLPPRVLLIGGRVGQLRKARRLGLEVVHVRMQEAADVDLLRSRVEELHAERAFAAVVGLHELALLPAAMINETLGLGGESVETVELLLDKARMRQRLAARGIGPVASAVGRTTQDLRDFVRAHGLPVVVKPVRESGSLAILPVREEADVEAVVERYRALGEKDWDVGDLAFDDSFDYFLMEEFLDGPEISVETLSHDGRHVVVAFTDKETGPGFVEVGHSQPSRHPVETLREVARMVAQLLDAVGLHNGPAHTEVKLTSRGPRIVESHNRIGGGRIGDLTEIVHGVDMERHWLGAGLGVVEPLTESPEPRGGAAVRVITPEPGRVVEVSGLDDVRADPACVDVRLEVGPGDVVPPLTWNEDKVGHVIARGDTAAEAIEHSRRLAATIKVRTEAVA